MYISWQSLPYSFCFYQCLICNFFVFAAVFIHSAIFQCRPSKALAVHTLLFSLLLLYRLSVDSCTCSHMQTDKRHNAHTSVQTYVHIHAHMYNYTQAMTMRNTHFLLRRQSHICSAFNVQSLTHSATKVMQSMCGVRCCYPVILLYLRKNGKPVI